MEPEPANPSYRREARLRVIFDVGDDDIAMKKMMKTATGRIKTVS